MLSLFVSLFGHPRYQRPTLNGRLHWASTETATDYPGHIEGALAAGERAAKAVLAATGVPNGRSMQQQLTRSKVRLPYQEGPDPGSTIESRRTPRSVFAS